MEIRLLKVGLACAVIAGCSEAAGAVGDPSAIKQCEDSALVSANRQGTSTAIAGGFNVAAATLVAWQETRHGPAGPRIQSSFRSYAPSSRFTVCYVDGAFSGFSRPPRGDGTASPPYDRLIVILLPDGSSVQDVAGYQTTIAIRRPGPGVGVNP